MQKITLNFNSTFFGTLFEIKNQTKKKQKTKNTQLFICVSDWSFLSISAIYYPWNGNGISDVFSDALPLETFSFRSLARSPVSFVCFIFIPLKEKKLSEALLLCHELISINVQLNSETKGKEYLSLCGPRAGRDEEDA